MGQHFGFVALGGNLPLVAVIRDATRQPSNPTSNPGYRVYGPGGLMVGGTGTLTPAQTGTVTGATNASPIVVTSAGHGLTTGTRVTITGATGNTAANTTTTVTVVDANTFSLDGTTGNGTFSGTATWNISGVYAVLVAVPATSGYVSGQSYSVLVSGTVAGNVDCEEYTFVVV